MTDNEIIKALECCSYYDVCLNCPCFSFCGCTPELLESALNLINRQKAEIERLKTENRILSQKRINFFERIEIITAAEVRAVKEFAERLKDLKHECGCNYRKKPVFAVTEDKIDKLVKEWQVRVNE